MFAGIVRRAKKDVKNILKVLSEEQATQMCFQMLLCLSSTWLVFSSLHTVHVSIMFYTTYANNKYEYSNTKTHHVHSEQHTSEDCDVRIRSRSGVFDQRIGYAIDRHETDTRRIRGTQNLNSRFALDSINEFVIKPVQRLLRYKLLLRDMQKLTDAFHEDYDELSLAI